MNVDAFQQAQMQRHAFAQIHLEMASQLIAKSGDVDSAFEDSMNFIEFCQELKVNPVSYQVIKNIFVEGYLENKDELKRFVYQCFEKANSIVERVIEHHQIKPGSNIATP